MELRTTACECGTRTTWCSKAAVGSQARAGSLWLSRDSSEMRRCVFCSLVGSVARRFPMAISDLMNSRSGASRTGSSSLSTLGLLAVRFRLLLRLMETVASDLDLW